MPAKNSEPLRHSLYNMETLTLSDKPSEEWMTDACRKFLLKDASKGTAGGVADDTGPILGSEWDESKGASSSTSSTSSASTHMSSNLVMTSACVHCNQRIVALDEECGRLSAALAAMSMEGPSSDSGEIKKQKRSEEHLPSASSSPMASAQASPATGEEHQAIQARLEQIASDKTDEIFKCWETVHFSRPAEEMVQAWLMMYPRYT